MGWALAIADCIWSRSSLPPSQSSIYWVQASRRTCSTTTVWDARWTGCTRTVPPRCSPASPGIARQARQRFGVTTRQVHVDTSSFAVSGEYAPDSADPEAADAHTIAVTYGYSRDHRADLKQ